jgi:hypothetical protein
MIPTVLIPDIRGIASSFRDTSCAVLRRLWRSGSTSSAPMVHPTRTTCVPPLSTGTSMHPSAVRELASQAIAKTVPSPSRGGARVSRGQTRRMRRHHPRQQQRHPHGTCRVERRMPALCGVRVARTATRHLPGSASGRCPPGTRATPCRACGQSVADTVSLSGVPSPDLCPRHHPQRLSNTRPVAYGILLALLFAPSEHSASSRGGVGESVRAECEPLAAEHVIPYLGSRQTIQGKRKGCISASGHVGTPPTRMLPATASAEGAQFNGRPSPCACACSCCGATDWLPARRDLP